MVKVEYLHVEKLFPSGVWQVTASINGKYTSITYFFYTKREAERKFRRDAKNGRI